MHPSPFSRAKGKKRKVRNGGTHKQKQKYEWGKHVYSFRGLRNFIKESSQPSLRKIAHEGRIEVPKNTPPILFRNGISARVWKEGFFFPFSSVSTPSSSSALFLDDTWASSLSYSHTYTHTGLLMLNECRPRCRNGGQGYRSAWDGGSIAICNEARKEKGPTRIVYVQYVYC